MIVLLGFGEREICPYLLDLAGGGEMEKPAEKRAVKGRKVPSVSQEIRKVEMGRDVKTAVRFDWLRIYLRRNLASI